MNLKEYKREALSNASYRKEYETYDLAFEIGQMVIDARVSKGLTQKKLAELANTKQPSIARLENGENLPSLSFLEKIAKALDTQLLAPKFAFLNNETVLVNTVNREYSSWEYVMEMPTSWHVLASVGGGSSIVQGVHNSKTLDFNCVTTK